MKQFSEQSPSYEHWRSQNSDSPYVRRIERLHNLYPGASLSQLRGHPKNGELPLKGFSKNKRPANVRDLGELSPKEQASREKSLAVVSEMRRTGSSLSAASAQVGVSPETVRRNTGIFSKRGAKWFVPAMDRIHRPMLIYEKGRSKYISVTNSSDASLIGQYHNAIGLALRTGNSSDLRFFGQWRIEDESGRMHFLETNMRRIYDIMERRENEEFYSIYKY